MKTLLSLQNELIDIESSERNVILPKQDNIQWDKSIEMFAHEPLMNEQFGILACIGFTVKSFDADEKTMRLLELEMSVIETSKVNGCAGRINI